VILFLLAGSIALAGPKELRQPTKTDKCPVCGMFVYKYSDFLARVIFQDGSVAYFDGPKDLFKYLLALKKYNPGKTLSDVTFISVTEYYRLTPIDAKKAYYVMGSDVYGPMGRELIPFEKNSEALEFMKDHLGKIILRYKDITASIIKGLD
jgi:copper chaperone NosL